MRTEGAEEEAHGQGVSRQKPRENLEAELIGVLQSLTVARYGDSRVMELDTTRSKPIEAAEAVHRLLSSRARSPPRIDWTRSYTSAEKLRSSVLRRDDRTSPYLNKNRLLYSAEADYGLPHGEFGYVFPLLSSES